MNELHVVVGAGPVGSGVARILAGLGERVRVVTRNGGGPDLPAVERVAADASDAERLAELSTGARAVYNCANPPYHRWPQEWPPLAASILRAAERSGAVLATVSNLYGYGPVDGPIHEDLPLAASFSKGVVRARMWVDALAAHEAGRVRATEIRASDYLGYGAYGSLTRLLPRIRAGKAVRVLGDPDAPHTFTYTVDTARLLVRVAADECAWGAAWHVPSNPARTAREVVTDLSRAVGVTSVTVNAVPRWGLTVGGWFVPALKELPEVMYQHDRPFLLDDSRARVTFGMRPAPWSEIIAATVGATPTSRAA